MEELLVGRGGAAADWGWWGGGLQLLVWPECGLETNVICLQRFLQAQARPQTHEHKYMHMQLSRWRVFLISLYNLSHLKVFEAPISEDK